MATHRFTLKVDTKPFNDELEKARALIRAFHKDGPLGKRVADLPPKRRERLVRPFKSVEKLFHIVYGTALAAGEVPCTLQPSKLLLRAVAALEALHRDLS